MPSGRHSVGQHQGTGHSSALLSLPLDDRRPGEIRREERAMDPPLRQSCRKPGRRPGTSFKGRLGRGSSTYSGPDSPTRRARYRTADTRRGTILAGRAATTSPPSPSGAATAATAACPAGRHLAPASGAARRRGPPTHVPVGHSRTTGAGLMRSHRAARRESGPAAPRPAWGRSR